MKREKLLEIVSNVATAESYAFHTGEMQNLSGEVRMYPAVWLAPPTLKKSTGRKEGELTYRVALHVMTLPSSRDEQTPWEMLERDALNFATEIALKPEVCAIANLSCTPAKQSLTPHGEQSVVLECDVTMWYYI